MDKFRVIIAGGRDFDDYELLRKSCDICFRNKKPYAIICGEARGADKLGKRYAEEHSIEVFSFVPEWDLFGKAAGYIRNEEMAQNADALVAFWDGHSRGTRHMIETAQRYGLKIRVFRYDKR